MKRLNTFLEGLLNKSNKSNVISGKEFIISVIEERIKNMKSDLTDRMGEALDVLKTTYTPFTTLKLMNFIKPRGFIYVYDRGGLYVLYFVWIKHVKKNYYWKVVWNMRAKGQICKNLLAQYEYEDKPISNVSRLGLMACYEVPEEDMKDYFRVVNTLAPLPVSYDEDKKVIVQQVIN